MHIPRSAKKKYALVREACRVITWICDMGHDMSSGTDCDTGFLTVVIGSYHVGHYLGCDTGRDRGPSGLEERS